MSTDQRHRAPRIRATRQPRNEAIFAVRAERGLSRVRCAKACCVSVSTLRAFEELRFSSRLFEGEPAAVRQKLEQALRVAAALGLTLRDVLAPGHNGPAELPVAALLDYATRTRQRLAVPAPDAALASREAFEASLARLTSAEAEVVEKWLGLAACAGAGSGEVPHVAAARSAGGAGVAGSARNNRSGSSRAGGMSAESTAARLASSTPLVEAYRAVSGRQESNRYLDAQEQR